VFCRIRPPHGFFFFSINLCFGLGDLIYVLTCRRGKIRKSSPLSHFAERRRWPRNLFKASGCRFFFLPPLKYPWFILFLTKVPGKQLPFTFDKVLGPDTSQKGVFDEVSQLLHSALEGTNVLILAYGQPRTGKTYTLQGNLTWIWGKKKKKKKSNRFQQFTSIEGSTNTREDQGVIPRSVFECFSLAEKLKAVGWTFKFEASLLQIKDEEIQDLLENNQDAQQYQPAHGASLVSGLRAGFSLLASKLAVSADFYLLFHLSLDRRASGHYVLAGFQPGAGV